MADVSTKLFQFLMVRLKAGATVGTGNATTNFNSLWFD